MRLRLLIILSGIVAFGWLFLSYHYSQTEGFVAQPEQNLEISKEINKSSRQVFDNTGNTKDNNIQELVEELYSSNEKVRLTAKTKIIKLAENSGLERKKVIDSIILSLDIPNNLQYGIVRNENYEGWTLAVMILGEIKASEVLPNLIKCLDCNNGIGGYSLYRYSVAHSISMMGDESILYLEESLQDADKSSTFRLCALLALDSIDGEKSRKALENALLSEKSSSFRKLIIKSLNKR